MILYYLLIHALPFVRHPLWSAAWGDFTVVKYLGIACVVYAFVYMTRSGKVTPGWRYPQLWWFVTLMALAAASFFTKGDTSDWEHSPLIIYLAQAAYCFTTLTVIDSRQRLRTVLLVAIGSLAYESVYVIKEWLGGLRIYGLGFRPGWVAGDANYYSGAAILIIPLALCLMRGGGAWMKWFLYGCLAIIMVAFGACASRGGFVGLAVAGLLVAWRSEKRLRNMLIAATVVVGMEAITAGMLMTRIMHPTRGDVKAIVSRAVLWTAALDMIGDHPFVGVGLGNFSANLDKYLPAGWRTSFHLAHSSYLEYGAELGLTGLVAFLCLLYTAIRRVGKVYRRLGGPRRAWTPFRPLQPEPPPASRDPDLRNIAAGLQAGLIGFAIAITTFSGQGTKMFWFMVFLSACLERIASETGAPAPAPAVVARPQQVAYAHQ